MTDINDLRERVEAAEQRFGLMDEQQRHYSERVIGLIETIEAQLQAARGEIEKQIDENLRLGQDLAAARGEIAERIDESRRLGQELAEARGEIERHSGENLRLSQENEELRRMLHSVLRSIEQKTHMKTLQDLEARVSALVTGAAAPAPLAPVVPLAPLAPTQQISEAEAAVEVTFEAPVEAPIEAEAVVEAAEAEAASDAAVVVEAAADDAAEDTAPAEMETEDAFAEGATDEPDSAEEAMRTAAEDATPEIVDDEPAMLAGEIVATEDAPADAPGAEIEDFLAGTEESNAGDDAFGKAGSEDALQVEAEAPVAEAAVAEAEYAGMAEETGEAASDDDNGAQADDVAAPTVKEIIRRVGDLARELERAEAVRRASRASEETAAEATPLVRVVNG